MAFSVDLGAPAPAASPALAPPAADPAEPPLLLPELAILIGPHAAVNRNAAQPATVRTAVRLRDNFTIVPLSWRCPLPRSGTGRGACHEVRSR
ncbi:hypothetical protein GTS_40270 [Gandjariella thermophila]|uniref:Uncharacterized protein n=1 Tax=Gandjariella thermophila TaxID=1931992 RepID=A0A4D4JA02_9PSEU|nr:hypothetical protein GTS_40270 [Gandjariella thermophila]